MINSRGNEESDKSNQEPPPSTTLLINNLLAEQVKDDYLNLNSKKNSSSQINNIDEMLKNSRQEESDKTNQDQPNTTLLIKDSLAAQVEEDYSRHSLLHLDNQKNSSLQIKKEDDFVLKDEEIKDEDFVLLNTDDFIIVNNASSAKVEEASAEKIITEKITENKANAEKISEKKLHDAKLNTQYLAQKGFYASMCASIINFFTPVEYTPKLPAIKRHPESMYAKITKNISSSCHAVFKMIKGCGRIVVSEKAFDKNIQNEKNTIYLCPAENNKNILSASWFDYDKDQFLQHPLSDENSQILREELKEKKELIISEHGLIPFTKISSLFGYTEMKDIEEIIYYYFKQYKENPEHHSIMYEIEAINSSFYELLIPDNCTPSRAIYDEKTNEKKSIGNLSKSIDELKTVRDHPITIKELTGIEALKYLSLSKSQEELKALQAKSLKVGPLTGLEAFKYLLLTEIEALKYLTIEQLDALDEIQLEEDRNIINKRKKQKPPYQSTLLAEMPNNHVISSEPTSLRQSNKTVNVTAGDLQKYRLRKSLGKIFIASKILKEDDLHIFNFGIAMRLCLFMRLDYDESLKIISYIFKKLNQFEKRFRYPGNRFIVTAEDIDEFPNLINAQPFYWPAMASWWVKFLPEDAPEYFSKNLYHQEEVELFQAMKTDDVFKYHQFATQLKFILTDKEMYRNRTVLHAQIDEIDKTMYQNVAPPSQCENLPDMFTNELGECITSFTIESLKSKKFPIFMKDHGHKAFKNIIAELYRQNERYREKAESKKQHELELINLEQIIDNYIPICAKLNMEVTKEKLINELKFYFTHGLNKDLNASQIFTTDSESNSLRVSNSMRVSLKT